MNSETVLPQLNCANFGSDSFRVFLCDVAFLVELETVYFTQCMTNNYDVTIGASNSDSIRKKTSSKMNLATF